MNREKFDFLMEHLVFQHAFPTRIEFKVAPTFDPRSSFETYTRVNWTTGDIMVTGLDVENPSGAQHYTFMRFAVMTRTRVAQVGPTGIPADTQEPEESDVLMDASLEFGMEYLVHGCNVDDLDQESVAEFFSKNVPFHMWPYFRELVQSLATRSRVPLPTIPPFRVPSSHQPKAK